MATVGVKGLRTLTTNKNIHYQTHKPIARPQVQ